MPQALFLACLLAFPALAAGNDTVSAWVTGVKFARGANRDRVSAKPPPALVADFRANDGNPTNLFVARVDWKDRHFVQHRFSRRELASVDVSTFGGLHLEGVEPEDEGIAISDVRFFRDPVGVAANCGTPRDHPLELPAEPKTVRRIRIPYLPYGEVELLADGRFRYAYYDWTASDASEIVFDKETRRPIARYYPKLDGTYNAFREKPVVKTSARFEDVLPDIPNPPSPWRKVAGTHVWRGHAASDRARDRAVWQAAYDHGIRKVCVTDHETMWRDGGEAFTMKTEAAPGKGGDAEQRAFSDFMNRRLGYWYGPYNNYTDYQPSNARWWNVDRVTRTADGNLCPAWLRSYSPKATRILDICREVVPAAQAKFAFRGAYCDVHTAVTPWSRTDYDPREPGAGMFRTVYEAYCALLDLQKRLWEGPVWSEGGCHFMYAGHADGNYARDSYDFQEGAWLVDFDVLKLHPLECDFGMGALFHFAPSKDPKDRGYYRPAMPEGRARFLDEYIAATLAFGHAGYLVLDWCWEPMKIFGPAYCGGGKETFDEGMPVAMKSYFMTQAIAARYTQSTADEIRYFDASGAALDTSAAVRDGAIARRQVYVRYANGTHVLVNGHPRERLRATVAGVACDLPGYGYRAWTDDGEVLVESGDGGGTGARTDRARCPDYDYAGSSDGRVRVRFRETDGSWKTVTCDGLRD